MVKKDKHKVMAIGISIFLSLMLWIYVMGEKNPVQTRVIDNVKVSLENTDYIARSNLVLLPKQDFTISISVSGRVKDLIAARGEDFKLEADMSGYLKKGDNDITVIEKSLPKGITINDREIPKVKVKLDSLSTRFVPVSVVVKGNPNQGYEHISPTTEPTGVMISGPKSYVDDVSKVIGKVNIEGAKEKVTKTISVEPVNGEDKVVTNVSIEPKFIDVTVDIAPYKEVPIVVKTTGSLEEGLILEQIVSKVNTVKIVGPRDIVDKIKLIETESFDLSSIKETVTKEIKLILPTGISTKSYIKSVGVEIKVKRKAQKDFTLPLNIIDKQEGYKYEVSASSVDIRINEAEELLNKINKDNISATINVAALKEGENTVQVKVTLDGRGEVSGITPDKVVVKVTKSDKVTTQ